jgi:hypothetical protein
MFDRSVPYPNASTEPLGAIESATCYAYPEDLVTRRFRGYSMRLPGFSFS